jgi:hypothetical protein
MRRITCGNEHLSRSGLVAFTRCGHWWVYDVGGTVDQLHDLARFNLGIACSFCVGELYAATHVAARGTDGRVN